MRAERWVALAALLLLALTGAQDPAEAFRPRPGWFTGLSVGVSQLDDAGFDDEAFVGNAYAGVQPLPYLAVEAGYVDLGSFRGTAGKLEAEGFYGDAVLVAPVTDRVDVYGKGGVYQWNIERTAGGSTTKGSDDDVTFGGGFSVLVSPDPTASVMEVQGEWTRYRVDSSLLSTTGGVDVLSLSLVGHFL